MPKNNLYGFTLIEVMLGMTLLSIIVVLLFSTLRISAQSWEAGENKIAQVSESALVYHFFQRHLATARPLWKDSSGDKKFSAFEVPASDFAFQGTSNTLQFVSAFPASAGRPGLQLFNIEWAEQDGKNVIKVTITPFFTAADGQLWEPEEEILLDDVQNFQLAYFGFDENSGAGFWQDTWLDRRKMPNLVKISIARTQEMFWPEMIIALKIANFSAQPVPQTQP
ncbi:MAG: prepilin-type cleavage/methylation domain-containing protein [Gammaproteobacteria bacterium HGW-Gammaproteobacteria-3]|nr:MAG: prepilin-type cleavage/methylation domain-containing protein [Gammaproteobacteria bacterium HGW-Gammaproteobacteria-3]